MFHFRNSILATIVYYDIFDFPLTGLEIHRYLINPARLAIIKEGLADISLDEILRELAALVKTGLIGEKDGLYFLVGRDNLAGLRNERKKISLDKFRKLGNYSRWLGVAPYLKGILASGSIALDNANIDSDLDVLIIVKPGRLYTCRFFLWLISSVLGIRRKPNQTKAPDKLCFNHYITEENLVLPDSLFNAQTYANLKPVLIRQEDFLKLYSANIWINNYLYNFRLRNDFNFKGVDFLGVQSAVAKLGEFILDSFLGDRFEKIMRWYQQRRIKINPMTYESGGRVVFTDQILEFHPRSFESVVIERYNLGLARLGIVPFEKEKDSGLIPSCFQS